MSGRPSVRKRQHQLKRVVGCPTAGHVRMLLVPTVSMSERLGPPRGSPRSGAFVSCQTTDRSAKQTKVTKVTYNKIVLDQFEFRCWWTSTDLAKLILLCTLRESTSSTVR